MGEYRHFHKASRAARPLVIAFCITSGIFVLEVIGGLWSGSLALIADAMHMAADLVAMGLGLFAAWVTSRPPDAKRTFGYHRAEVLAALGNGVGLWITVGILLHEAWERFQAPNMVRAPEMLAIAVVGLSANLISAAILYRHSGDNINLRGVMLHVASDALGSVGAITAGLIMWKTGWMLADPLATVFICVVISIASFRLVRESTHILLEGTPAHIDADQIREALKNVEGVAEVHDLHLWSLSSKNVSMSGHLVAGPGADTQAVLQASADLLEHRFGIAHTTLQVEKEAKGGSAHC